MNHRSALLRTGVGLVAVLSLAGCCSEKEKQRVSDKIDRAIERNFEACESISDPARRADCIINAQDKQSELIAAELAYLTACSSGDQDAIEEALRLIRSLLGGNSAVPTSGNQIVNRDMVFGRDEMLAASLDLVSDGVFKNTDVVVVGGVAYLPEAAGTVLTETTEGVAASTVMVHASQSEPSVDPMPYGSQTFTLATGSTIFYSSGSARIPVSVSGSLTVADRTDQVADRIDRFANRADWLSGSYVPTDVQLTLSSIVGNVTLSLNRACSLNSLEFDGTAGVLGMEMIAKPASAHDTLGSFPSRFWIELPVTRNQNAGTLAIDFDANGWELFPCLPNPIADHDDNGVVDSADHTLFFADWAAGRSDADVNHDGAVDSSDSDAFISRWLYWSAP